MSALPPKADIGTQSWNVRFVPKAEITAPSWLLCRRQSMRVRSRNNMREYLENNSRLRLVEIPGLIREPRLRLPFAMS